MADVFKRTALATRLAKTILEGGPVSAASSGLFLSAPRRTGKSTFIREDLRPVLQAQGALVLYVDLWENKQIDPGQVIVTAVRAELAKYDGVVTKLAKSIGLENLEEVSIAGALAFSLDKVGMGQSVSLSMALRTLSDEIQKPIVLVIDEAQQAITTGNGADTLFALKAARDEINSSLHHGLRIVCTGSNQDKLAMLRNSKDQAFFGAALVNFPPLDRAYVAWFCERVQLEEPLQVDAVFELFKRASYRPEILYAAGDVVKLDFETPADGIAARFAQAVEAQIAASNADALQVAHSLTVLQSAVLRVLAARGNKFAPFEAPTHADYLSVVQATSPGHAITPDDSNVQQALVALQDKSLIWRAARGVYLLEEASLAQLLGDEGFLDVVPGYRAQGQDSAE